MKTLTRPVTYFRVQPFFFSILFTTFSDFCSEHAQLRAGRGFAVTKRFVVPVVSFGFARQFVRLKIRCRAKSTQG